MANTRQNVWELGDPWAPQILWYARGVAQMQSKTIDQPTSWNFYGAIHGFQQQIWQQLGFWSPGPPQPNNGDVQRFWVQCQHGTWYFLPWHRGYLLAFEANIRAAMTAYAAANNLPAPPADWALPYWNYFKPNENPLPPAFASQTWPDGGNNPLFIAQRFGPNNDGNVFVDLGQVNLDAMNDSTFTGGGNGVPPGFGGAQTGFMHAPSDQNNFGGLESQPHNIVHVLVGGPDPQNIGLMSDPDTAGLDPIFWLHHANIDRLWEVWRENPASNVDPTDPNWLNGPAVNGDRKFSMPMPDGTAWDYTPADMEDLGKLGYTYDDLSPAVPPVQPFARLLKLGATAVEAATVAKGAPAVPGAKKVELVGANDSRKPLPVTGREVRTVVRLDPGVRSKVEASLTAAKAAEPDRVFLKLENVRGEGAPVLQVYIKAPGRPEMSAGSVGMFGLRKASLKDGEHAGRGLTSVLEITKLVDELHLNKAFDVGELEVRIAPLHPIPDSAPINIGRVSIYRHGR